MIVRGVPLAVNICEGVETSEDCVRVEESEVIWWVAPESKIQGVVLPGVADMAVASELDGIPEIPRYDAI